MEESNYEKQREDFEFNQANIRDAYLKILEAKQGRKPTNKEIAEKTGLSIPTVRKHLKEMNARGFDVDEVDNLRILSDDVKLAIYQQAVDGNVPAMKLWLQVVEGWVEKGETKHSGKIETVTGPPVIIKIT